MRIAIVGAECTGKTQLAQALVPALQASFDAVTWEPEYLREWCASRGRTPLLHEQRAIAEEQLTRILGHADSTLLLCDTTPLLTAVYSDVIFNDATLYPWALEQHQAFAMTFLTGLDIPWVADGIQRDGPAMRTRIDHRLREILHANRLAFSTVCGDLSARVQQVQAAILHAHGRTPSAPPSPWKWTCEKCSDAACEHQIFTSLIGNQAA